MKRLAVVVSVIALFALGCQKGPEAAKKDAPKAEAKGAEAAKPADPAAKPADPAAKPADPAAKPADPAAKPADPAAKPADAPKGDAPAAQPTEAPKADSTKPAAAQDPATPPADASKAAATAETPKGENDMVIFETSMGTFKVKLYPEKTPISVKNFLQYVDDKFYDGTVFHRIVPGFVIQGGGYTADLEKKATRDGIPNEAQQGIKNKQYTLSMARTQVRDSATSQFFVSLEDNPMLDYQGESPRGWGYAAFGEVVEGKEVIDAIGAVKTGPAGPFPSDVPKTSVVILKAYRVPAPK